VLDKIGNTQTGAGDRPVKEMKIIKAKILDWWSLFLTT
jgi:hypothetical protein